MSRGPGKVERRIEQLFQVPETAYTVDDLCAELFTPVREYESGLRVFDRAARVSVTRAAKKVCERTGWRQWRFRVAGRRGGPVAFYDPRDVVSYGMARLKVDAYPWQTDEELRERLDEDRHLIDEGGVWWVQTQKAIAMMDGDTATAQRMDALLEEAKAASAAALGLAKA